ncbi:MAG: hypothetical protein LBM95_04565 [Lactobacillales bacterium]|jgi:hypothetical protein|nr:hypothetical protein [Lactobacillales bacterium]
MRKSKILKNITMILFPLILIFGVILALNKETLMGSETQDTFVQVKLDGKQEDDSEIVLNKKEVAVELTADEDMLVSLDGKDKYDVLLEDDTVVPELKNQEFQLANYLSDFEQSLETSSTTLESETQSSTQATEESSEETELADIPNVFTIEKDETKTTYLKLNKGEALSFKLHRLIDETIEVNLMRLTGTEEQKSQVQKIFSFQAIIGSSDETNSQKIKTSVMETPSKNEEMDPTSMEGTTVPVMEDNGENMPIDFNYLGTDWNEHNEHYDDAISNFSDEPTPEITEKFTNYTGAKLHKYDWNKSDTWLPTEYAHFIDFSSTTMSSFGKKPSAMGRNSFYFDLPLDTSVATDFGVIAKGVKYDNKSIDIVIRIVKVVVVKSHNPADKTTEFLFGLDRQNDTYFLNFSPSYPTQQLAYRLEFKDSVTHTPIKVQVPITIGDIDGKPVDSIDRNGASEQHRIEGAINSPKYPKFFIQNTNPTRTLVGTLNSNPNDLNITTNIKYANEHNEIPIGAFNIDNLADPRYCPSVLFSGTETNTQSINNLIVNDNRVKYFQSVSFKSILPTRTKAPVKYVSDSDESMKNSNTLNDYHEKYKYTIDASFPFSEYDNFNMKSWVLTDTLPAGVTLNRGIGDITCTAISNASIIAPINFKYTYDTKTRKLTITVTPTGLANRQLYRDFRNLRFTLPVKVNNYSLLPKENGKIAIKNTSILSVKYFNNTTENFTSNQVTTTVKEPAKENLKLTKLVDKKFIDSGNTVDPANPTATAPTNFKYSLKAKNDNISEVEDTVILDVLPKNSDSRGTKFNGTLTPINITLNGATGDIYYNTGTVAETADPNSLVLTTANGWNKLGTNMTVLANATAIVAVVPKISSGNTVTIDITMKPSGQKAGDVYDNNAHANSEINWKLDSNKVETKVLGRELTGTVWYDNNYNGLLDTSEAKVKDIPIKLYRTSIVHPTYAKQLVKESATGESFIDSTGKSKVLTNTSGEYHFRNLLEGMYTAEFVLDGRIQTKELRLTGLKIGTNEAINSKVNVTKDTKTGEYQTKDAYNAPTLDLLSAAITTSGATDSIYHIKNVHAGLLRASEIDLFKYITGTAIDKNKDGVYSDEEKATGTPISGAEFEVYQGKLTDKPASSASSYIGRFTTDSTGHGHLAKLFLAKNSATGKYLPTDYTLFETKVPAGYELLKTAIPFKITAGNQLIHLFAEDDRKTLLPFAGGENKRIFLIIIGAMIAIILGIAIYLIKGKKRRHQYDKKVKLYH